MCEKFFCNLRHPKNCKYHTRFGYCKFGISCSFLHVNTDKRDVETLKKDLAYVIKLLNAKDNQIEALEMKANKMEDNFRVFSPVQHIVP